jgi:hypothetical protein
MRFHYEAYVWQVWRLFRFGTITPLPIHPLPLCPHTYTYTAFVCHACYCIRSKCEMVIEMNTCDREGNFICNWLGIEMLIEIYFNVVWISFVLFMHV